MGLGVLFSRDYLGRLMSNDPEVWALCDRIRPCMAIGIFGLALLTSNIAILMAQGRPLTMAITVTFCTWGVGFPTSFLLATHTSLELLGIWVGLSSGYGLYVVVSCVQVLCLSDWQKCADEAQRRSERKRLITPLANHDLEEPGQQIRVTVSNAVSPGPAGNVNSPKWK